MRWGRKLAAIQHSKQTAWTIRDRSCSLPLAIVVVVVVAVVVAKYPPLCLDLSGSGWVRRIRCCGKPAEYCETAYLLPVFSPGMQSAAAPCAGTPISCLVYTAFRDRRPGLAAATRWRSAAGVGAGSGLGKRRRGEAKLTARSSCPRCDWRAGQSLDGRAWNGRASGCGPRQHAVEERPRLKPLTVSVAATVINHGRFPWHRRDLVGLGSGVPSL